MVPPRRSAFEVSFPNEPADEIREDAAAATQPGVRSGPGVNARKDAKRKKVNSIVDTRVSGIYCTNDTYLIISAIFFSRRHQNVAIQHLTMKIQDPLVGSKSGLPSMMCANLDRQPS